MILKISRLSIVALIMLLISACKTGYVYNDERSGAIFVKPKPAVPKPVPKPFIRARPKLPKISIFQQNQRAITVLNEKGFEAEEHEKGVVVYLPPTIYFKDSQSTITLTARTKIAEIAQELLLPYLSNRSVEVSGHTDTLGSSLKNMALSKERALAATAELVFSKVPNSRLSSSWFGETRLRVKDHNQDGSLNVENRNLNRRVEFLILNPR